eukprot:jgi/Undpi1/2573/HiC_scaffold_13.g05952.m1
MAAVASGSRGSSVVEKKANVRGANHKSPGGWGADKPLAYSDVAHLRVDSVLFALRLRANSLSPATHYVTNPGNDNEDPAIRGRRNREAERRKRNAKKLKSAEASAAAGGGGGGGAITGTLLEAEHSIQGFRGAGVNDICRGNNHHHHRQKQQQRQQQRQQQQQQQKQQRQQQQQQQQQRFFTGCLQQNTSKTASLPSIAKDHAITSLA